MSRPTVEEVARVRAQIAEIRRSDSIVDVLERIAVALEGIESALPKRQIATYRGVPVDDS